MGRGGGGFNTRGRGLIVLRVGPMRNAPDSEGKSRTYMSYSLNDS